MYNYGMPSPVMQGYNPYSYQGSTMQRVNNNLPHYEIIRGLYKKATDFDIDIIICEQKDFC